MPVIKCENTDCKYISKRKTKFINGENREILCHTCKSKLVNISPIVIGDEGIVEYLGYQPYECTSGGKHYD